MALAMLAQRLATRIGLDVDTIGRDELARAIRHRSEALGWTEQQYLARVGEDATEWSALVEALVVRETWFFREPTAFTWLSGLAREPRRGRLRVLCAPCATGEEPYSVVMTLLDAGLTPQAFRVDALDISHVGLAYARAAAYEPRRMRLVTDEVRCRHFEVHEHEWRLHARTRDQVHFAPGNLVEAGTLDGRGAYDVIFCRNVLIYFTQGARANVLAALRRALRPDGWLVTGHAETSNVVAPHFVSARVPRTFVYRPSSVTAQEAPSAPSRRPRAPSGPPDRRVAAPPAAAAAAARPRTDRATPAPSSNGDGREPPLEAARRLADAGRLDEARERCREHLADMPDSADAHRLLGVIDTASRRWADAEASLRRAVYLRPHDRDALTGLAMLRTRAGDHVEADRLRQRASRATRRG